MARNNTTAGERTLSLCIPTHHGRAPTLAELLGSIGKQAAGPGWQVEVCVSDNASRDGTADVVEAFGRETGIPVTYHRNDRDLGLAPNMFGAMRLASGRWCWPLGSDDHLAEDALQHMTTLLDAFPCVTGVTQPRANFARDMRMRIIQDRPEFYPLAGETTIYRGERDVLANVGSSWAYLGCQTMRTDLLSGVLDVEARYSERYGDWPQMHVFGSLAVRHPTWLWFPMPLVKSRSENSYFIQHGQGTRPLATVHADAVAGLGRVWDDLIPPRTPVHDEITFRMLRVWAGPEAIRVMKAHPEHRLREDWALARTYVSRFNRLREFWRRDAPALAVPGALQRTLAEVGRRRRRPMRPLPTGAARTTIAASVAPALQARRELRIPVAVCNEGPATLASASPNPVHLSYRWYRGGEVVDEAESLRTPLRSPLGPGERAELEVDVLTPWRPGVYELRLACVQEFVAWFDDVAEANGARFDVDVSTPSTGA